MVRPGFTRGVSSGAIGQRHCVCAERTVAGGANSRVRGPSGGSAPPHGVRHQNASVEMTEHLLAALSGLQIDNCEVWVDQPEMPGLDGSSQKFVEALDSAGTVVQTGVRPQLIVPRLHDSVTTNVGLKPARAAPRNSPFAIASTMERKAALAGRRCKCRSIRLRSGKIWPGSHVHAQRGSRLAAGAGLGAAPCRPTCWCSIPRGPSITSCASVMNVLATKCSIWSAIWPWPAAT